jgi:hypothetical protein
MEQKNTEVSENTENTENTERELEREIDNLVKEIEDFEQKNDDFKKEAKDRQLELEFWLVEFEILEREILDFKDSKKVTFSEKNTVKEKNVALKAKNLIYETKDYETKDYEERIYRYFDILCISEEYEIKHYYDDDYDDDYDYYDDDDLKIELKNMGYSLDEIKTVKDGLSSEDMEYITINIEFLERKRKSLERKKYINKKYKNLETVFEKIKNDEKEMIKYFKENILSTNDEENIYSCLFLAIKKSMLEFVKVVLKNIKYTEIIKTKNINYLQEFIGMQRTEKMEVIEKMEIINTKKSIREALTAWEACNKYVLDTQKRKVILNLLEEKNIDKHHRGTWL